MPRRPVSLRRVDLNVASDAFRVLSARIVNVIVEFMDNDKGYVAWLAEHPDGFVLNCDRQPSPRTVTIHVPKCGLGSSP